MTLRCLIGGCDWCRQPALRLAEETFDCERCLRCGALRYSGIQRR
ncbi:TPA: PSPA7_2676 family Cys-rich small protein [Pseudomonas aeruginosa]|nr:PSPA7_2676 family Cys-rich small protein [Pseudomonas aeruginosa]ESR70099.1 Mg(2+) transporter [Pseudomonas aeruginosa VRFPA05]AZZ11938.1 Mg(2+) transporter [Pseudomonas aeruginosa]ERV69535.1 hypothetical protein Q058_05801 [Pseudomonas aeruginosa BL04]ERX37223.1 hypothetical protein Q010_02347 [Pseudomonas aeruginosa 19660]KSD46747.1 Mg(2+) transporter [Pseudomonas aeruginosa]